MNLVTAMELARQLLAAIRENTSAHLELAAELRARRERDDG